MSRTLFVYDEVFLEHDAGSGHPESPGRLIALLERLNRGGTLNGLLRMNPQAASIASLERVHESSYIEGIRLMSAATTADTVISPATYECALRACGGVQVAIDEVAAGRADNAFCAHRPPGHHAEASLAMGFCYINHVAVAARYLQDRHGIARVAVLDWDVHHGNGTQHAFYGDPSVFYFSVHQAPHYPGTGSPSECGVGEGLGTTLNVPLPAGSGDDEYVRLFGEVLRPALETFCPDFILLSAGFDAHLSDPLGGMEMTVGGFESLTTQVMAMAADLCGNRLVSLLEGGYDLEATAASVDAHLRALSA